MTTTKILNCRLNETLSNKFDLLKNFTGYDSDAECVRYLINISFDEELDKIDPNDIRIQNAMDRLEVLAPKVINKKFNGNLPSLKEQRKRFILSK
jgi:hypothetical protein